MARVASEITAKKNPQISAMVKGMPLLKSTYLFALGYGITQLIWHAIRLWRWKRYLKQSHLFEDNKTDRLE